MVHSCIPFIHRRKCVDPAFLHSITALDASSRHLGDVNISPNSLIGGLWSVPLLIDEFLYYLSGLKDACIIMSKLCKCMCYFLPSVSVSIELSPPCFADLATPAAHFPGGWIMLHQICHVLAGFPTRQSALSKTFVCFHLVRLE